MKPLVSILIPAYNAEEFIGQTIESALAQTWPRKEVIVVDDGSKDRTLSIARQFAGRGVTVITKENQGAAATRNCAYARSHGDFIQWLDADDLLSHDKVARQMEEVEKGRGNRTALSCGWGYFLHRPHKADFTPTPLWSDLSPVEWMVRKLSQNLHMQTATWLVSRELTEAAGPWNTQLLGDDDGEYFSRVLLASNRVRFVPGAKVFYRQSVGSLSYIGRSDRKMEAQFLSMKLTIGYVRRLEESPKVRAACVKYLQNWLPSFYPARLDIVEQANELAVSLGGKLGTPQLPWKYAWIQRLFGWDLARHTQLFLPQLKWSLIRSWDKAISRFDPGDLASCKGN